MKLGWVTIKRSESSIRSGLVILLALLLFSVSVQAQEPTEGEAESRERKIIAELRAGSWEIGKVEQLVRALIQKKDRHAARWWTQMALDAAEAERLPADTEKRLIKLGKTEGLPPSEPQLRAMPARALKHLKKVMSLRTYSAAPEAIHFARRCLELYQDRAMIAEVDAIEASLETVDRKEERPTSAVLTKSLAKLVAQLGDARDELLEDMVAQYERYPCPPGARAIRALMLARGEEELSPEWRQTFDRLAKLEFEAEPKLVVKVWIENGGKVAVYRNGRKYLGLHSRSTVGDDKKNIASFEVVAGDILQFEVMKLHAKNGDRKLFVVAAAAEVGGRSLPERAWFQNANDRAASIDPLMNPMCRGMPFSPAKVPEGLTEAVLEQVRQFGEGILFPTTNEHHHYVVDLHENLTAAAEVIKAAGQSPTWLATEGDRLVIALRIPR